MSAGEPPAPLSIAGLLERYPVADPPISAAGAAVTIVVRAGAREAEVLLIERTVSPADPASGQVALPGGRVEDRDGNLRATAARELAEEVGLTESDLRGPLRFVGAELAARFGLRVGIFAGELDESGSAPSVHQVEEVAHVFWLPRSALDSTETVRMADGRGSFDVPANRWEGHLLWGFTRRVVRDFFGLPPERDVGGPMFAAKPASARGDPDSGPAEPSA